MEEQNIQNEQTEHKLNPILNLTGRGHFFVYNFARLRDWRVVQMADAQGVIREVFSCLSYRTALRYMIDATR